MGTPVMVPLLLLAAATLLCGAAGDMGRRAIVQRDGEHMQRAAHAARESILGAAGHRRNLLQTDGQLRLVGGNATGGRLEMYSVERGYWGTVCDDNFDDAAAIVACRQLGLPTTAATYATVPTEDYYGPPPTGPSDSSFDASGIFFDGFYCTGNEDMLKQCADTFPTDENCAHSEDIALNCGSGSTPAPTPTPTPAPTATPQPTAAPPNGNAPGTADGQLRLFGGNATSGRLEMYSASLGFWGTVCDDNFDGYAARVACRQLGLPSTRATYDTVPSDDYYGTPPSDPTDTTNGILFDGFSCTGDESRLVQCADTFPTDNNCAHSEDIAIYCAGSTPTPTPSPKPSPTLTPTPTTTNTRVNGDLRLYGGNTTSGRLEMYSTAQSRWGTVCDDNFDSVAASIACRQMGFLATGASWRTVNSATEFGPTASDTPLSDTFFDGFSCQGNEARLIQCASGAFPTGEDCSHSEDVALFCRPSATASPSPSPSPSPARSPSPAPVASPASPTTTPVNGDVRLYGGNNNTSGRLEMYSTARRGWGTVCDDNFTPNAARVACRQLGLSIDNASYITIGTAYYGPTLNDGAAGNGIFFDGYTCYGNETRLTQCAATFPTTNDCSHSEDIALTCQPASRSLSPSSSPQLSPPSPRPLPPSPPSPPAPTLDQYLACNVPYRLSASTTNLDLTGLACTGTLPSAWSALGRLTKLSLGINNLHGTLPESWSALSQLRVLWLGNNYLTGTLPKAWSTLVRLEKMQLFLNGLTGELPSSWSTLSSLQTLGLGGNNILGTLPTNWSALRNLTVLELSDNVITGTLPQEWSALRSTAIPLYNNLYLKGQLPQGWVAANLTIDAGCTSVASLSGSSSSSSSSNNSMCNLRYADWPHCSSNTCRTRPPATNTYSSSPSGSSLPAAAFAQAFSGGTDGSCPPASRLVTYDEAALYQAIICSALEVNRAWYWSINRLAPGPDGGMGGSFDGPGYNCGFRATDERGMGASLCVPTGGNTPPSSAPPRFRRMLFQ